jgi:hypothetical protein
VEEVERMCEVGNAGTIAHPDDEEVPTQPKSYNHRILGVRLELGSCNSELVRGVLPAVLRCTGS